MATLGRHRQGQVRQGAAWRYRAESVLAAGSIARGSRLPDLALTESDGRCLCVDGVGASPLPPTGPGFRQDARSSTCARTSGAGAGCTISRRRLALVSATYRSLRPRGDASSTAWGPTTSTESNSSPFD